MTSRPLPAEGSKPSFKDVKAGAWYTGWINAAESLNLVQGDGNGTFRPNDTISNQEVITVLMRMLGYNDNLPGAWPTNYVTQANKDDVLDDVSIVAAAAAKRGDVAVMVSNALDTEMVTYDKDTDEFVNKQQTKGGQDSQPIKLLEDAFDGAYVPVTTFAPVEQVKDVAKQQLTWNAGGKTFIIDNETRVSANGGDIFSLEGHQGNVYFVEDGGKLYAKFIEVESYVKRVSDPGEVVGTKVEVGNTKYNAADTVLFSVNAGGKAATYKNDKGETVTETGTKIGDITFYSDVDTKNASKNSKYLLYFNDDDQVYAVASDKDLTDKAYFVESVGANSTKLIGSEGKKSVSMDDDEVLIWNGTEFVAPSTLEVGDAIIKIEDDLYELTEAKTGVLKSSTSSQYNIDGTNYKNPGTKILDGEFEDADAEITDIYNNTVTYLLNDDNTISAIIVDEVSTGTKLYGVIVDAEIKNADKLTSSGAKKVSIFTEEGTTVEYTLEDDFEWETGHATAFKATDLGKLVEYKLNKDGEIKDISFVTDGDLYADDADGEIEVKNNTYLVAEKDAKTNLTLASNVAIFEVTADDDDDELTVELVTRAALLAGGDFKPGMVNADIDGFTGIQTCSYFLNTNGAARAMVYTDADTSSFNYGVIDDVWFSNSDFDENNALTLVGDETTYEFGNIGAWDNTKVDDDYVIVYTVSGDEITIWAAYDVEPADNDATYEYVTGYTDGLITLAEAIPAWDVDADKTVEDSTIMTDANTVVYVINDDGEAVEGDLGDISKNAYVYVPVMDDGVADIVIVNEYSEYTNFNDKGEAIPVEGDATIVVPTSAPEETDTPVEDEE